MGKLRIMSATEVCRILINNGFREMRTSGSHIVMQRKITGGQSATVTAIVPNHTELAIGTLLSIIRQSQLPRSLFES